MIEIQDKEYLLNKYHKENEPFDAYNRMAYHGYDYDPSTGLADEEMKAELSRLSDELAGMPHAIIKARLFEFVLDHTRIDVNEHDYFIGLYSWSRIISPYTVHKWTKEIYHLEEEAYQSFQAQTAAGFTYGGLDFEHTVPDWDALMQLGFSGLLNRMEKRYQELIETVGVQEKQQNFYLGMTIEYKAVIRFIDRLYQYALTRQFEKAPLIAKCLLDLREGAPQNTFEAMQMIYIYFMLSESVDHYQVRSLGFGLDNTLYPFYMRDIENGTFSKAEIEKLLAYFLMQWQAIGNYWGQPLYLGGTDIHQQTKVNELSYLILDVYDKLGLYNPKIQIKVSSAAPKDFILKALDMIRSGVSSIVFCNEDVIIKALMSRGSTYEEAVDSVISGCYEYKPKKNAIGVLGMYWNALKPVSLVFDNGYDDITNSQIGLCTGDVSQIKSFAEFYRAYLAQLEYLIRKNLDDTDRFLAKNAGGNPSLLFSGTMEKCVNSLTDALEGGLDNTTDTLLSGIGTTVDALMAVYELVFEQKIVTLPELKAALDKDWQGYAELRNRALHASRKYGNGNAMADHYAAAILRFVSDIISGRKNSHGGKTILEIHSARAFIIHGEKTKATPDGRRKGDETSKNASPTPGADTNGVTALIKSATTLDTNLANNGFCLDAMLHPSAVQGEDGLYAFYALLQTYMKNGGASIHFNIFSPEILRDAQAHPEKYRNLQVRVCGWNVLWNNMAKSEQDAYILRAENIQ